MTYLLDTHAWIWWNIDPEKLSSKAIEIINNTKSNKKLLLSAISIWEFSKLVELGRLSLKIDGEKWIDQALKIPNLQIVPLSPTISWKSTQLPQPFHKDPADQIIVSTAREEGAIIITKDSLITNYPHVQTIW